MKTRIIFIVFLIFTISCNKKEENLYFFDFDEIEYYHKNIIDNDIFAEYDKIKFINYDNTYLKIGQYEYPKDLNNSKFSVDLLKFGYTKKVIEKSKLSEINKIFSKKTCTELTANGCIPIYRDIFIFKKNGIKVGIAKICFECRIDYIIGSKQNWDYFGECGDYEKLQQIIKTIK
jgi:hypothetical protein